MRGQVIVAWHPDSISTTRTLCTFPRAVQALRSTFFEETLVDCANKVLSHFAKVWPRCHENNICCWGFCAQAYLLGVTFVTCCDKGPQLSANGWTRHGEAPQDGEAEMIEILLAPRTAQCITLLVVRSLLGIGESYCCGRAFVWVLEFLPLVNPSLCSDHVITLSLLMCDLLRLRVCKVSLL